MNQNATDKVLMLLIRVTTIMAMFAFVQVVSAQEIPLAASSPAVIYYTTNGADPISEPSTDSSPVLIEPISLVPNAGKGTSYVKPHKLKIHESKYEFEKHVKQKHGKRFKVMDFSARQTENGLDGHIDIVENRNPETLQLGDVCTEEELAKRIAIARDFFLNNPELIGLTGNEELRGRGERNYCGSLYFDRYINGYELQASGFRFGFVPQWNFSMSVNLKLITPEMYAAAQQKALTEAEVAAIVYADMNIPAPNNADNSSQKLPKLQMRKYLIQKEPYVVWDVRGEYIYKINALTGEIIFKKPNVKY